MITIKKFDAIQANKEEWEVFHDFRQIFHLENYPNDPLMDNNAFENSIKAYVMKGDIDFHYYSILDRKKQIGSFSFYYYNENSPSFKNNEKLVTFDIKVLINYRNKGIGSQALREIVEQTKEINKSIFKTKYDIPESKNFIDTIGAKTALIYGDYELTIKSVNDSMLDTWIKEASKLNNKTSIKIIEGSIPDTYIKKFVITYMESINSQPHDSLERGDEIITIEQYRKDEETIRSTGRKIITILAIEENNTISGITQVKLTDENEIIEQGITGVLILNRGKKIGKWLKAEMLLYLKKQYPDAKTIISSNTDSNKAINNINKLLGFKQMRKMTVVQVEIKQVIKYLQSKKNK